MRIAYFGGSFDPPHYGHLAIAIAAASAFSLDRVLFAPTGRQPLKSSGADASYADRLAMVSLLCSEAKGVRASFKASDVDAPRSDGSPNYTVTTLARLRENLSTADTLYSIVGADAFVDLPRWRSPKALFNLAEWIVVSRPGVNMDLLRQSDATLKQPQRVHILEGIENAVSATMIRERLRAQSTCDGLLPQAVLDYIQIHHLYRS
jgi:nicotinate-nucleotide adenylyltransferase